MDKTLIWILMNYHYLDKLVSFFSRRWSTQKPTTGQGADNKRIQDAYLLLGTKWDIYITSPISRLRDHYGRGSRKIIRARGNSWLQGNTVFQKQHGSYTNEPTLVVTAWPVQLQVRPNLSMDREGRQKVSPLYEELLAIVSHCKLQELAFFKGYDPW